MLLLLPLLPLLACSGGPGPGTESGPPPGSLSPPGPESSDSASEDTGAQSDQAAARTTAPPSAEPPSAELPVEDCSDGADNDGDGFVDCADPDCLSACTESDCSDGLDDDRDGLVDCEDADCLALCVEGHCSDGLDGEGDGYTDCEDEDCWGTPGCEVIALQVNTGSGQLYGRRRWSGGTGSGPGYTTIQSGVKLSGMSGSVSIHNTSSTVGCDWSAQQALFWRTSDWSRGSSQGNWFHGLNTSGACGGLLSSHMLRDLDWRLQTSAAGLQVTGGLWNQSWLLGSFSSRSSSSYYIPRGYLGWGSILPARSGQSWGGGFTLTPGATLVVED